MKPQVEMRALGPLRHLIVFMWIKLTLIVVNMGMLIRFMACRKSNSSACSPPDLLHQSTWGLGLFATSDNPIQKHTPISLDFTAGQYYMTLTNFVP